MALLLKGAFALAAATLGIGAYAQIPSVSNSEPADADLELSGVLTDPVALGLEADPSDSFKDVDALSRVPRAFPGEVPAAPETEVPTPVAPTIDCTAWKPERSEPDVESWASFQKRGCLYRYDGYFPMLSRNYNWFKNFYAYRGRDLKPSKLPVITDYRKTTALCSPSKESPGFENACGNEDRVETSPSVANALDGCRTCFPVRFHHKTGLVEETLVAPAGFKALEAFFRQQVVDDSVLEAELDIDEDFLYSPQDYAWQSATFELEAALHPYLAVGNLFPISLPGDLLAALKAVEDARKSSPEKEWPRMQMLLRAVKVTPKNDTDFMSPACQRAGNDYRIVRRGPLRESETPWGNITLGDAYVPQDGPARLTANAAQYSVTESPTRLELDLVEGDGAQVLSSPWIYLEKAVGTECNWRPKSAVVTLELRLVESEVMTARASRIRSGRGARSRTDAKMLASRWRLGWRRENPPHTHFVWKHDRRRRALERRATLPGLGEAKDSDWTLTSLSNNYTVSDVTGAMELHHRPMTVKPKRGLMTGLSKVTLGSTTDPTGASFSTNETRSALCTLFRAISADDDMASEHSEPSMLRSSSGRRWDSASFAVDAVLDPVPWGNTTAFALPTELVRFLSQNVEHVSDAAELYLRGVVMKGIPPATSASSDDGECFTGTPLQGYTLHAGQRVFSDAGKSANPTWTETLMCPPPYPSSLLNYATNPASDVATDSAMINYNAYLDPADEHETAAAQRKVMFLPNDRQERFKLTSQWLFLRAPERPVKRCEFNPSAVRVYFELTFKPERLSRADRAKLKPLNGETEAAVASYTEKCFPDKMGRDNQQFEEIEGGHAALEMPSSFLENLPGLAKRPPSVNAGRPASDEEEADIGQISTEPRLACENWRADFKNNEQAALEWVQRQGRGCGHVLKILLERHNRLPWSKWSRRAYPGQGLLPILPGFRSPIMNERQRQFYTVPSGESHVLRQLFIQQGARFPLTFSHATDASECLSASSGPKEVATQQCPPRQMTSNAGLEGIWNFLSPRVRNLTFPTREVYLAESRHFVRSEETGKLWDKLRFKLGSVINTVEHSTQLGDRAVMAFALPRPLLDAFVIREPAAVGAEVYLVSVTFIGIDERDLADDSTCLKNGHVRDFRIKPMSMDEVPDADEYWTRVSERSQKFAVHDSAFAAPDAAITVKTLATRDRSKEPTFERGVVLSFPSGVPVTNAWFVLEKRANSGCYFTPRAIATEIELRLKDTSRNQKQPSTTAPPPTPPYTTPAPAATTARERYPLRPQPPPIVPRRPGPDFS